MPARHSYDEDSIVKAGVRTINSVQSHVQKNIKWDPAAFSPLEKRGKPLSDIDKLGESIAKIMLHADLNEALGYPISFLGEESMPEAKSDLSHKDGLIILMDMVDGTDLLERNLSNWCSAMVVYDRQQIISSFVGLPGEGVFWATKGRVGAFKSEPVLGSGGDAISEEGRSNMHLPLKSLAGPSKVNTLRDASIAFYGQKVKNFLAVAAHAAFRRRLVKMQVDAEEKKERLGTRIYNLAGNPLMVKMVDGDLVDHQSSAKVDAVFDISGQSPHDVVPGAFIARKAGAVMINLEDGKEMSDERLLDALMHPADTDRRLRYVLGATRELARELASLFLKRIR